MLGHRGCRLGISFPEIYETQVESIFEAIFEILNEEQEILKKNFYKDEIKNLFLPEIMIPLVGFERECEILINMIHCVAKRSFEKFGFDFEYKVGTMIELPRAALIADKLAKYVDFLSFGTNDLTQTTLGLSRDDMISFLNDYSENKIFDQSNDPFVTIDEYVAVLMKKACDLARSVKPEIKIGICGEHGGDPKSIEIFKNMGINYVSTSPFRLPIALLAIAKS
jgi:pyruvate,orthophosphate dikinase